MTRGLKRVRERRTDALAQVGWQQLEALLASHYAAQGYDVEHCGTGAAGARFDGGVDLRLRRGDATVLVQVKHWNACKVPHNDVHQLLGVMVNEGATGAILVTSGEFTQAAMDAARRHGHVQLVDGDELRALLGAAVDGLPCAPARSRASEVAEAAAGRPPSRPRPDAKSARQAERRSTLVWLAITVLGMLLFLVLIRGVFEKTRWTAGPGPSESAAQTPPWPGFARPADEIARATPDRGEAACLDGTGEGCGTGPRNVEMSAAERRLQQQRADEAMRVIEASTPEM